MKRHAIRIAAGTRVLRADDPVMAGLISRCPPLTTLKLQTNRYEMLVQSILSQQISVHAAKAIRGRLADRLGEGGITPEGVAALDAGELRGLGVSGVKVRYLHDLSEKVHTGELKLDTIGRKGNAGVIDELTEVRGIGVWTAQMFLIFALGRLNVFPLDDHGVRSAIRKSYSLEGMPDKATSLRIAERWRGNETIATWYLWRSHELTDVKD